MSRYGIGIIITFCFVLAGCGTRASSPVPSTAADVSRPGLTLSPTIDKNGSEWPVFRRDDQRTGNNPYQTAITAANVGTLKPKWTKATSNGTFASPVVANGVVYEGDRGGNLFAWNISNGAQVWAFKGSATAFIGSPYYVASTKTLYVGEEGGTGSSISSKLYSINATTGKMNWQYTVPSLAGLEGSPLVANGLVYEGTDDKNEALNECDVNKQLVAVSPSTGKLVSSLNLAPSGLTGADIWSAPSVDPSNNVYVGTGNECETNIVPFQYAQSIMQLKQGKPTMGVQWSMQSKLGPGPDFDFGGSPIYVNGMIVDTGKDGYTYALNANTGAVIWITQTGQSIASDATDGTRLYIPSATLMQPPCMIGAMCGSFVAVNLSDGSIAWSVPVMMGKFGFADLAAPAVSNGVVFAAFNGHVWAFNASTGATLWSYAVPDVIFGGITVVNGGVLVGEYPKNSTFYDFTPNGK